MTAAPYDTLDDVLAACMALLEEGASDPGSIWRNPVLATAGLDGTPQARIVVLRRFDPGARDLELHTDTRSAKHAELLANPLACLHGWDDARRIQLRLTGAASLHTADTVAEAAWSALRPASRATYDMRPGPGAVLGDADAVGRQGETAARAVFCVIRLRFDRLDWLHLRQGSHLRARFTWAGEAPTAMWLVP